MVDERSLVLDARNARERRLTHAAIVESDVEELTLQIFANLRYEIQHGPDIAPDEPAAERASYGDVVLVGRLEEAIRRLNPTANTEPAIRDAVRKVLLAAAPTTLENNRRSHRLVRDGVEVEVTHEGGDVRGERLRLFDFENPDENDWVACNQLTIIEGNHNRRPDVVVFVNGLPLAVIELKNAADENATIQDAFHQLQTYKKQIPSLFQF